MNLHCLCRSLENISPNEERPRSEPQVSSTEPGPMDVSHNNNNNTTTATKYGEPMESSSLSQLSSMGVPGLTQLDTKVGISSDLKPDDENKCFICKVISQFASVHFRLTSYVLRHTSFVLRHALCSLALFLCLYNCHRFACIAHTHSHLLSHRSKLYSPLCLSSLKTGIKDLNTDAFLRGRNFYFHQSCANVMSSYRLNKELLSQQQQQQAQQREAAANTATPRSLSPSPAQSPQQSVATPAMD